jgi:hypothetical protein
MVFNLVRGDVAEANRDEGGCARSGRRRQALIEWSSLKLSDSGVAHVN